MLASFGTKFPRVAIMEGCNITTELAIIVFLGLVGVASIVSLMKLYLVRDLTALVNDLEFVIILTYDRDEQKGCLDIT